MVVLLKAVELWNSRKASRNVCHPKRLMVKLACVYAASLTMLQVFGAETSVASEQSSGAEVFVAAYRCMIVEQLVAIHERGNPSKSRDRFFILAMTHSPQRFVQCIFHDIDTVLLCEASSGRYGSAAGKPFALELSEQSDAELKRLGFTEPTGVANYEQEIALGDPPDYEAIAKLMLTTMYTVYGAREGSAMNLQTPLVTTGRTKLDRCKPVS